VTKGERGEDVELSVGQMLGGFWFIECAVDGTVRMPYDIPLFIGKIRTDRLS
jgi:hypothetical protein